MVTPYAWSPRRTRARRTSCSKSPSEGEAAICRYPRRRRGYEGSRHLEWRMRTTFLVLSLAALVLPDPGRTSGRTIFADEFSGSELDRSHWNVIVTGRTVNNEQQAYVDSPDVLSVAGGALVIRPRFRQGFKTPDGRSFDFISGRIDTRSK